MTHRAVEKYRTRYAEPESRLLGSVSRNWTEVAVIPACREADGLFAALRSLDKASAKTGQRALIVLVINARENATAETLAVNQQTLHALCEQGVTLAEGMTLQAQSNSDVWVVDRTSEGRRFPNDQGVGLARKIGCDLALELWAQGALSTEWIRTTDADATVPDDYFESRAGADASTLIAPFHHTLVGDESFQEAIALYDIWLRYYVLALGWARSPFAFQTVGSTMAMRPESYAQVRGFPRKKAAEDFYLLNKLAKVGRVHRHEGAPIHLHGRPSDRVPFGTGAGVTKIHESMADESLFQLYDPRVFERLRTWLQAMNAFAEHGRMDRVRTQLADEGWEEQSLSALESLGGFGILQEAADNTRSTSACRRRLHTAFDAFRTLRLVHELRDGLWPNVPWQDALHAAPFLADSPIDFGAPAAVVYGTLATLEYQREGAWSVGLGSD
jgi:hypothetical protein